MPDIYDINANTKVVYFDDYLQFLLWLDDYYANKLTNLNCQRIKQGLEAKVPRYANDISKYGTTNLSLINGPITTYLFNNELDRYIEEFNDRTAKSDKRNLEQKRKIKFTSQEIGIFSFDLASAGLIRSFEYFSPLLNRIVANSDVFSREEDGKVVFYHIHQDEIPEHDLDLRYGLWYSPFLKINIDPKDAVEKTLPNGETGYYLPYSPEVPEHAVEQRQKVSEDGRPIFTSTTKKSFVYLPELKLNLPKVDLILPVSFSWGVNAATQMLYNCFAPITVGLKLEQSNVKTSMVTITGSRSGNKTVYTVIKIKQPKNRIDRNRIASIMSDGRFFRRLFFSSVVANYDYVGWGNDLVDGLGFPINDVDTLRDLYSDILRQRQEFDNVSAQTVTTQNKLFFRQCLNERAAVAEYDRMINVIQNLGTPNGNN